MTNTKHTPGPWFVLDVTRHNWRARVAPESNPRLNTAALVFGHSEDHVTANARLIAAAPELLAALEDLLEYHSEDDDRETYQAAFSAILKARGEE